MENSIVVRKFNRKWEARIWLWLHKKPDSPGMAYYTTVVSWLIVGLFIGLITGLAASTDEVWASVAAIAVIVLFLLLARSIYKSDKDAGYIEAIHKHYLTCHEANVQEANRILKG